MPRPLHRSKKKKKKKNYIYSFFLSIAQISSKHPTGQLFRNPLLRQAANIIDLIVVPFLPILRGIVDRSVLYRRYVRNRLVS